jgi:repressor of nif and glnA expression
MIGLENHEVERKVIAILKILSDSQHPLGGRVIAHRLGDLGIELGERAVRYHLKLLDEKGLTRPVGNRDGRTITPRGIEEVECSLVSDRVGSIAARIKFLAYRTSLDLEERTGEVLINTSLFSKEEFDHALEAMKDAFRFRLCVSDLVTVAPEGGRLGEVVVPEDRVGLATVSSVAISGALLKAGIPLDSKFAGILQTRRQKPPRFIELIEYSGCSLDPAEIFIASKLTKVGEAAYRGEGRIIASLHELPATCRPAVEAIVGRMERAGLGGLVLIGKMGEPMCEVPVALNKVGMIIQSGLNPVAAAVERGIDAVNHAMSGVIDCRSLRSFWEL